MNVLVAGCGDLGTEVGLRFAARGHAVTGIRRATHRLPPEITGIAADLGSPLPELPSDIEVVVYAAAPDARTEAAYRRTFVDGPRHVLDALDTAGAPRGRLLLVSSTAVYGVGDGSVVDERTPTEPSTPTGAVLVEAERALHARRSDAVALRLGGVYGPGRTRLITRVRQGSARIPSTPVITNRIHRDDAAEAIVHLMTMPRTPPPTLVGVDDHPAELADVLRFLADELGVAHPPVGNDERTRGGSKRCSNAALVATGFACAYPSYREGYRAVCAGMGTRHP